MVMEKKKIEKETYISTGIVEAVPYEIIDIVDMNGTVIKGFNVDTYNHKGEKVVKFIPEGTFLKNNKIAVDLDFSDAFRLLMMGYKVTRKAWKDMYLTMKNETLILNYLDEVFDKWTNIPYQLPNGDLFAKDYRTYCVYYKGVEIDENI